LINIRIMRLKE